MGIVVVTEWSVTILTDTGVSSMFSITSLSSYYTISLLPLKATVLEEVVHMVTKISVPIPCWTYSNESFTCYFNNVRNTSDLPTARCTGHPQMTLPHSLAFRTVNPFHLLKTLIYLASDHHPLLVFLPGWCFLIFSTFNCWNYPELSHQTLCLFTLQMALNTIYMLIIPLFTSPSRTFSLSSRILYKLSNSNSSFGCLVDSSMCSKSIFLLDTAPPLCSSIAFSISGKWTFIFSDTQARHWIHCVLFASPHSIVNLSPNAAG